MMLMVSLGAQQYSPSPSLHLHCFILLNLTLHWHLSHVPQYNATFRRSSTTLGRLPTSVADIASQA